MHSPKPNPTVAFLVLSLIYGLFTIGVLVHPISDQHLLLLLLFLIGITPWIAEGMMRRLDIFECKNVFILAYLVQYALWGFYVSLTEHTIVSNIALAETDLLSRCVLLAIIGLIAFYVGYYVKLGQAFSVVLPDFDSVISKRKTAFAIMSFVLIGLVGAVSLFSIGGGLLYVLSNLNEVRLERFYGLTHLRYLLLFLYIAALLYLALNYSSGPHWQRSMWLASFLFLAIFLEATVGHRLWAMFITFSLLVCHHYLRRRIPGRWVIALVVAVVAMNVVYVSYRDTAALEQVGLGLGASIGDSFSFFVLAFLARYHGIESLAVVVNGIASGIDFNYGLALLRDLFLIPIPLGLWPERPEVSSIEFSRLFLGSSLADDNKGGGVAITLLGDLYWMGGVVGIVLGMSTLGVIHNAVYSSMKRNVNPRNVAFYSLVTAFLAQLNEGLSVYVVMFLAAAIPLFLTFKAIGSPGRPARIATGAANA